MIAHGKYHGVMEQVALSVEHHYFAASAYAWVNTHDTFLPERRGKKQLPEILLEDTYSLVVGFFLAQRCKLILYRRLDKPFIAILNSLSHKRLARTESTHVVALQSVHIAFVVASYAHSQHALGLATAYGEQTMGRTSAQFLRKCEVVAVFQGLVVILHLWNDTRHYRRLTLEVATHRLPGALIQRYVLGNYVLRTLYRLCRVFHVAFDKSLRRHVGIMLFLYENQPGEWLKTLFTRHLRTRSAAWLERHIDVLYLSGIPRALYATAQVVGELALRLNGFQYGLLSFLQFLQLLVEVAHGSHLHLIEVSGSLLAVTADKGNSGASVEEFYDSLCLFLPDIKALGYDNGILVHC